MVWNGCLTNMGALSFTSSTITDTTTWAVWGSGFESTTYNIGWHSLLTSKCKMRKVYTLKHFSAMVNLK